jgi:hypothetical protein
MIIDDNGDFLLEAALVPCNSYSNTMLSTDNIAQNTLRKVVDEKRLQTEV